MTSTASTSTSSAATPAGADREQLRPARSARSSSARPERAPGQVEGRRCRPAPGRATPRGSAAAGSGRPGSAGRGPRRPWARTPATAGRACAATRTPHHAAGTPTTRATAPTTHCRAASSRGPAARPAATAAHASSTGPAAARPGSAAAGAARRRRTSRRRTPRPSRARGRRGRPPAPPPGPTTVAVPGPSATSAARAAAAALGAATRSAVRLTVVGTSVATSAAAQAPQAPTLATTCTGRLALGQRVAERGPGDERQDQPGHPHRPRGVDDGVDAGAPEVGGGRRRRSRRRGVPRPGDLPIAAPGGYFRGGFGRVGAQGVQRHGAAGGGAMRTIDPPDRASPPRVGSLPHDDMDDAVELALGSQPRLPAAPSLPRRAPVEGMIPQAAWGIAGVLVLPDGSLLVDEAAVDPDAPFDGGIDGEPFAGLRAFLAAVAGRTAPFKLQLTGPRHARAGPARRGRARGPGLRGGRAGGPRPRPRGARRGAGERARGDAAAVPRRAGPHRRARARLPARRRRHARPGVARPWPPSRAAPSPGCTAAVGPTGRSCWPAGPQMLSLPVDAGATDHPGAFADFLDRGGWLAWGAVPTDRPLGETRRDPVAPHGGRVGRARRGRLRPGRLVRRRR